MTFGLALYGSCILILTLFVGIISTFDDYTKKKKKR